MRFNSRVLWNDSLFYSYLNMSMRAFFDSILLYCNENFKVMSVYFVFKITKMEDDLR